MLRRTNPESLQFADSSMIRSAFGLIVNGRGNFGLPEIKDRAGFVNNFTMLRPSCRPPEWETSPKVNAIAQIVPVPDAAIHDLVSKRRFKSICCAEQIVNLRMSVIRR